MWVPDGLPAAVAVSRLIWQVLGPRPVRCPEVLSVWAGLSGPAPTIEMVLARYVLAKQTLTGWRGTVQHRARCRWAQLFTVGAPIMLPAHTVSPTERGLVKIAVRILAALGPMPVDEFAAAMSRTRPPTGRTRTVAASQLAALAWTAELLAIDPHDGMCRLAYPYPAYPPDLRLLTLAAASGRVGHNRPEMIELLTVTVTVTVTGYGASIESTVAKHPLLVHTARGHGTIRACTAPIELTPKRVAGPPSAPR